VNARTLGALGVVASLGSTWRRGSTNALCINYSILRSSPYGKSVSSYKNYSK
jgi:hypothetical protein